MIPQGALKFPVSVESNSVTSLPGPTIIRSLLKSFGVSSSLFC